MNLLSTTIASIKPVDTDLAVKAEQILAQKLEGDDSALGGLKTILLKYVGIAGTLEPSPPEKCTIICCGDHGVAQEGVSAYPPETTVEMTRNYLISRGAAANALASYSGSELMVVDMGIKADTKDIPDLIKRRIQSGTQNMAEGAAMSREDAIKALEVGIELANSAIDNGFDIIMPGEMGIANTTSSAAIAAVLCGKTAKDTTGRGTNISDERLARKQKIVERAIAVNNPNPQDGIDVLAKVGGFELGAIAGIILGASARHKCVILDGANSSSAALIAQALAPSVTDYLLPSHIGAEKSHKFMLEKLGLTPVLNLDLKLGEACGSSILVKILEIALALLNTLEKLPDEPIAAPFRQEYMSDHAPKITDKTFDFYLNTIQGLDKEALARAQNRLDNLAKPIYSLGYLEQIAAEIAGISGDELPPDDSERSLLVFGFGSMGLLAEQLTAAFATATDTNVNIAHLKENLPATAAFEFGRCQGEFLSFTSATVVIGLAELDDSTPLGTASELFTKTLLNADGSLRYNSEDFLAHLPAVYQTSAAAIVGAIIAAAHNNSLVIPGDIAVDIIARYAQKLASDVNPYILHAPSLLPLNMTLPCGALGLLTLTIVDAALACINKMRTFSETKVSTASDGPGAIHQIKD